MAKIKKMFLAGAERLGIVSKEIAEQIFDWIEKSQRYSFNASHSLSYSVVAYLTAYAKAHFPEEFFTSYLRHSNRESDQKLEIFELTNNSKLSNIEVLPPDIRIKNKNFVKQKGKIYFGLTDINGIGDSVYDKLLTILEKVAPPEEWTTNYLLFCIAPLLGYSNVIKLAEAGTFNYLEKNRIKLSFYLSKVENLTERERSYIIKEYLHEKDVGTIFEKLLAEKPGKNSGIATKARAEKIRAIYSSLVNPPFNLEDNATYIAKKESDLLGISLTCSEIDSADLSICNTTCKEFATTKVNDAVIGCVVEEVKEYVIKKGQSEGKKMAFLTLSDSSYSLNNVVIFAEGYEKYNDMLIKGNKIIVAGGRDAKKDSLVVKKIWQLL